MAQRQGEQAPQGRDQSLSLRVMRLCKPSFRVNQPLLCENSDIIGEELRSNFTAHSDGFPMSQLLTLPPSFGTIYLGEAFSSYVSIFNTSPFDVTAVGVKAELQVEATRYTLLEEQSPKTAAFSSGSSKDYIVKHTVTEEGVHILVCAAQYLRHDGERKILRKYFRFNVEKQFAITSRCHSVGDSVFVEVQLENKAKSSVALQSVEFIPAKDVEVMDMNQSKQSGAGSSHENEEQEATGLTIMKSGHCISYMYRVSSEVLGIVKLNDMDEFGLLDVSWRSVMGDVAKQQLPVKQNKPESSSVLDVKLYDAPKCIYLEQPFSLRCSITNYGKNNIIPRFTFLKNKMSGIFVNGVSGQELGNLPPKTTKEIELSFFPVRPGVHKINGIRIVNQHNNEKFDFDDLLELFVEYRPESAM